MGLDPIEWHRITNYSTPLLIYENVSRDQLSVRVILGLLYPHSLDIAFLWPNMHFWKMTEVKSAIWPQKGEKLADPCWPLTLTSLANQMSQPAIDIREHYMLIKPKYKKNQEKISYWDVATMITQIFNVIWEAHIQRKFSWSWQIYKYAKVFFSRSSLAFPFKALKTNYNYKFIFCLFFYNSSITKFPKSRNLLPLVHPIFGKIPGTYWKIQETFVEWLSKWILNVNHLLKPSLPKLPYNIQ